jgi:hypothetical protein
MGGKCTKEKMRLGVMVHTYNPSYLRNGDREDHGSRPALAKR